jgi:hypothetical protein
VFLASADAQIQGELSRPQGFSLVTEQAGAWLEEIRLLRQALRGVEGWIHLEFDIPRLGKRVDAVLVSGGAVVPIEFKVGAASYERADLEQAWDYGLDLKYFHLASHGAPIFPVLCATGAEKSDAAWRPAHGDGVRPPFRSNAEGLARAVRLAVTAGTGSPPLDAEHWGAAPYTPTPTIIEAARALYSRHSVHDITRNDAGAKNLAETAGRVEEIVSEARERGRKAIIFVTGVPGAGKTLVGLNVATRHAAEESPTHAAFLSGNGPLVAVLRESLARDACERARQQGQRTRIGEQRVKVQAFIQNVHHFRDAGLRDQVAPPVDHIVVFDEAQRAWDAAMLANFMKQKKGRPGFTSTEPEVLVESMDRHRDWAVVVCLVGGGQEINTGEAGISAWIEAMRDAFPAWDVHISSRLTDSEYAAGQALDLLGPGRARLDDALHLATSMRSFRSERVSAFVKALLDGDLEGARGELAAVAARYPIVLTRSLKDARRWIRQQRRGSERAGLVASSSAQRLKPHAIDVRVIVDPVQWFLGDPRDTRSSTWLEDAATEFQVQGLELDWTCVTWDADLRRGGEGWSFHRFRGDAWTNVAKPERRRYLLNAYRVLLTRARQGMVIFVPPGSLRDRTRSPGFYDPTFEYLREIGIQEI